MPTTAAVAAAGLVAGQSVNPPDINALLGGVVDRKKWYWYDTLKMPAGYQTVTTAYNFFAVPQGQADPYNASAVKTALETNLTGQGGQFSSPYDLVLTNIGFKFAEDMRLYDIVQIVKYGYFEFKILEKTFFKGHLWRHPPGAGFQGFSTQNTESVWNNGIADPGAIWYLGQWSKYIPPLTTFTLTLQFFESVGVAVSGTTGGTLSASATAAGQSGSSLPTLLTQAQGGNGAWLVGMLNGLSDGPVQ
jgi:hypothetical protein